MRETPFEYRRRTRERVPTGNLSEAAGLLGLGARPPREDEPCPNLYRDVGPQALSRFLAGKLRRLEGPEARCIFMQDATLPGWSPCARELGLLVLLQPLSVGPWLSGQDGIWVAERGRMAPTGTIGFVPGDMDLRELDRSIEDAKTVADLREALGGAEYDEQVEQSRWAIAGYLDELSEVARRSAPLCAALRSSDPQGRERTLQLLESAGLYEKDLMAPWFQLSKERRAEVRLLLAKARWRLRVVEP
jgi:hypothetical protein